MEQICPINLCSGCSACSAICGKGAIEMEADSLGHLYPQINLSKCVDCGACKKVCPALNPHPLNTPISKHSVMPVLQSPGSKR